MQFMVELTHGPDTCIAGNNPNAPHYAELVADIRLAASDNNIEVVDGWSFPIGHRLWYVVEADDPQSITNVFFAAKVHHWNTVQIHPVLNHAAFTETVLMPIISKADLAS